MTEANVHKILMKAMDFDECGEKELAIENYTQAVEMILSIDDPNKRQKLNKFAKQALGKE
jgi:calpain-7